MSELLVQRGDPASGPGGEGPAGPRLRLRERLPEGNLLSKDSLKFKSRNTTKSLDLGHWPSMPRSEKTEETFGINFESDSIVSTNNSFQAFVHDFQNNT